MSQHNVVIIKHTNKKTNPGVTTPTIFFQIPVAVHLPLGLDPVAAVSPQGGLVLGNHGGACGGK